MGTGYRREGKKDAARPTRILTVEGEDGNIILAGRVFRRYLRF
jgi:hypothetical protein